jgi:hypothetical protein
MRKAKIQLIHANSAPRPSGRVSCLPLLLDQGTAGEVSDEALSPSRWIALGTRSVHCLGPAAQAGRVRYSLT